MGMAEAAPRSADGEEHSDTGDRKRPRFGSRQLAELDHVFDHNAWSVAMRVPNAGKFRMVTHNVPLMMDAGTTSHGTRRWRHMRARW